MIFFHRLRAVRLIHFLYRFYKQEIPFTMLKTLFTLFKTRLIMLITCPKNFVKKPSSKDINITLTKLLTFSDFSTRQYTFLSIRDFNHFF